MYQSSSPSSTASPNHVSKRDLIARLSSHYTKLLFLALVMCFSFWGQFVVCYLGFFAAGTVLCSSLMFKCNVMGDCAGSSDAEVDGYLFQTRECCCCRKKGIFHMSGMLMAGLILSILSMIIYIPLSLVMLSQGSQSCSWNYGYDDYDYNNDWMNENYDDWDDWDKKNLNDTLPYYQLRFGGDFFEQSSFPGIEFNENTVPELEYFDYPINGYGCEMKLGHYEMKLTKLGGIIYSERMKRIYMEVNNFDDNYITDVFSPNDNWDGHELYNTFNELFNGMLFGMEFCISSFWNSTKQDSLPGAPTPLNYPTESPNQAGHNYISVTMTIENNNYNYYNDMHISPAMTRQYNNDDYYNYNGGERNCYDNMFNMRQDGLNTFGIVGLVFGICCVGVLWWGCKARSCMMQLKQHDVSMGGANGIVGNGSGGVEMQAMQSINNNMNPNMLYMNTPQGLAPIAMGQMGQIQMGLMGGAGGGLMAGGPPRPSFSGPAGFAQPAQPVQQQQQHAGQNEPIYADATYAIALQAEMNEKTVSL